MRILSTAASLVIAGVSVLLADCSSTAIDLVGADNGGFCTTAESFGLTDGIWVAAGLGLLTVIALALVWIPPLRPGRKRRRLLLPVKTLNHNLDRLPDVGEGAELAIDSESGEPVAVGLIRRLEAIEAHVNGDVVTGEATQQCMSLWQEANEAHTQGVLPSDVFKQINTRVLELFNEPTKAPRTTV